MQGTRNTGFVVSLALLASLVAHFAIHEHFTRQNRLRNQVDGSNASRNQSDSQFGFEMELSEFDRAKAPRALALNNRVVPALDVRENESESQPPAATTPKEVPAPTDSATAENRPSTPGVDTDEDSAAVRDVIEHELAHAPREERDIWFDELKTLPAGVVRDLLQVRKQLRALPRILGGMPEKLVSADPTLLNRPLEVPAERASQKIQFLANDLLASSAALEMAISQHRHNVTNASTPGFKRIRIVLVDAYSTEALDPSETNESRSEKSASPSFLGEGCRMAAPMLDTKQGVLEKTGRPFDLAIDGEGFFEVHRGQRKLLTRCGALTLDRERRLCLATTSDIALLHPTITIPEDACEIQISADGTITAAKSGETTATVIGQIQLARVASPSRLQSIGNTLFAANEHSGPVTFGTPMSKGYAEIQQGFLEKSNVEFERELEEIESLVTILKSLPLNSPRAATANSQPFVPNR